MEPEILHIQEAHGLMLMLTPEGVKNCVKILGSFHSFIQPLTHPLFMEAILGASSVLGIRNKAETRVKLLLSRR